MAGHFLIEEFVVAVCHALGEYIGNLLELCRIVPFDQNPNNFAGSFCCDTHFTTFQSMHFGDIIKEKGWDRWHSYNDSRHVAKELGLELLGLVIKEN
jgi:hypothetical protein